MIEVATDLPDTLVDVLAVSAGAALGCLAYDSAKSFVERIAYPGGRERVR